MSQKNFQIIWPVHVHLKTDKVDLKKKPPWKKNFLHFFLIPSSSRYEKHCQMSQRIYCLFQCSRNYLCKCMVPLIIRSWTLDRRKALSLEKHTVKCRKLNKTISVQCATLCRKAKLIETILRGKDICNTFSNGPYRNFIWRFYTDSP